MLKQGTGSHRGVFFQKDIGVKDSSSRTVGDKVVSLNIRCVETGYWITSWRFLSKRYKQLYLVKASAKVEVTLSAN